MTAAADDLAAVTIVRNARDGLQILWDCSGVATDDPYNCPCNRCQSLYELDDAIDRLAARLEEAERKLARPNSRYDATAREDAEARVETLEAALRPFVEDYDFHAADYLMELVDGEEARVFTARTVESLIEHQHVARAALTGKEQT